MGMVGFGHQEMDIASNECIYIVSEERGRRRVNGGDCTDVIDGDDRIDRRFKNCLQFLGLACETRSGCHIDAVGWSAPNPMPYGPPAQRTAHRRSYGLKCWLAAQPGDLGRSRRLFQNPMIWSSVNWLRIISGPSRAQSLFQTGLNAWATSRV